MMDHLLTMVLLPGAVVVAFGVVMVAGARKRDREHL